MGWQPPIVLWYPTHRTLTFRSEIPDLLMLYCPVLTAALPHDQLVAGVFTDIYLKAPVRAPVLYRLSLQGQQVH